MDWTDPYEGFDAWFAEARAAEPRVPEAMQVATVGEGGIPRIRTVLLKDHGPDKGFVFYTNTLSEKGRDLAAAPVAGLLFHWKSLERQVRVEGRVAPVDPSWADAYFASRPRGSQIGAWASAQSEPIESRAALEAAVEAAEARFAGGPVPRPPHWSGYQVWPERIELWQGRDDRLHDRLVFSAQGEPGLGPVSGWSRVRLQP